MWVKKQNKKTKLKRGKKENNSNEKHEHFILHRYGTTELKKVTRKNVDVTDGGKQNNGLTKMGRKPRRRKQN
jgi:hypothetical protein